MQKHFLRRGVIELANPQSEEASVMRSSLVPGMLNMLAYNLNRGADNVRLFEARLRFRSNRNDDSRAQVHLQWALPHRPYKKRKDGALAMEVFLI